MFTDIVGYTTMIGNDENFAVNAVTHHKMVIEKIVPQFQGEVIQFYGDGSLSIFQSPTFALECAMSIQEELQKEISVPLRVGLHIADILIKDGSIYGEGVNIASRIESLGQAGTILFSENVYQNIRNNRHFEAQLIGEFEFKNVDKAMKVYALSNGSLVVPQKERITGKLKKLSTNHESESSRNLEREKDQPKLEISEKSIAVLPFVNMSNDPEQEFFCEGISEEIINTIVQLPNIVVAGRTSSFSFKGKNEDLRSVGNTLGVSKILEGSVRKSGHRIRITAQLFEASTGFHLWSRRYDREMDDVFQIQDEISAEIGNQLKITFEGSLSTHISRQQTKNVEAYQLYCKGRSLFYQRGKSLFDALECFKEALKLDPNYALAYSGLADTYIMLSFHGYLSPPECWREALPAARNSLKYGPDLSESHNTMGVIALLHDRNLQAAEREFKAALSSNSTNLQARAWYGLFCLTNIRGAIEEGADQFRIIIKNDPLSSYAHGCFGIVLTAGNSFGEAIVSCEYGVKLDPDAFIARYALGHAYLWSGHLEQALEQCQIALDISDRHAWALHLIALTYLEMNEADDALKIFNEMERRYQDQYLPPTNLAIVAAALGKDDYALQLAHISVDIVDPYLPYHIMTGKEGEALRNIPDFDKILHRLGYIF